MWSRKKPASGTAEKGIEKVCVFAPGAKLNQVVPVRQAINMLLPEERRDGVPWVPSGGRPAPAPDRPPACSDEDSARGFPWLARFWRRVLGRTDFPSARATIGVVTEIFNLTDAAPDALAALDVRRS